MLEFAAAAEASEAGEDEDVVEVNVAGKEYLARRPSTAQYAKFIAAQNGDGADQTAALFNMVRAILGEDGYQHISRLIDKRAIDMDDLYGGSGQNPDGGIIDRIMGEFGARPTQPSTASSSSQGGTGRRSTGRSPGKGSTRSTSPSTAS